ncbi:MAG: hypothetical protein CMF22_10320 [Idiomarinaceae bacterium]|mgnify:CR=1 FL=1|nr:hypothetical protein [Idiomarinaceae bacterium]MBG23835.1 hypothetical protein [Idiomarinaceae bacterium]|tara:strand:+ start:27520 stop:27720 length:201 start_codon:yes stop_codon:yes gene_type:complete
MKITERHISSIHESIAYYLGDKVLTKGEIETLLERGFTESIIIDIASDLYCGAFDDIHEATAWYTG